MISTQHIEVFRTDVHDPGLAAALIDRIHNAFTDYSANFDLQDDDHILRVMSHNGIVDTESLLPFLESLSCKAEVLPD